MSTLVDDLLALHEHIKAACLIEGDVVTEQDAAHLLAAFSLITRICAAPKPTGPDAPGELRIS
jgi:hypothetical protein